METYYYTVKDGEILIWPSFMEPSMYNNPIRGSTYGTSWLRERFRNDKMVFVPFEVVELLTNG
jgi:hypothetical protein